MGMAAKYVVTEVLDERGRFVSAAEFRWLMNSFRDRYDCRRLCFALLMVTGLRCSDGVHARINWFDSGFTQMKMSQCKAHVTKKDGIVRAKLKPKFVPLPSWLSADLLHYFRHRQMYGIHIGEEIGENGRLFPVLHRANMRQWIKKLRDRYGHLEDCKWLLDIWQVEKHYDGDRKLLRTKNWYRVACHAPRANYCTAAYEVSGKDIAKTKVLTGHDETKDVEKYIKVFGIVEKKKELMERYMEPLIAEQEVPLLIGQKRLGDFKG